MNSTITFLRPIRQEAAWLDAQARVESYLRALRMSDSRQISRLAEDVIGIAQAKYRPGTAPVAMAMETLEACLAGWFSRLTDSDDPTFAAQLARGRLALTMGNIPSRWPEHLLREKAAPAEMINAMRAPSLGRGPVVQLAHMAPRAPEAAATLLRPGWQSLVRWVVPRMLTGLMVAISLLGAAVAATM